MNKPELKLDWCSYDAAKYAVKHWHYSEKMPAGKLVRFGVWEDSEFKGVVIFGQSAAPQRGQPYGMKPLDVCELLRVALKEHESEVTKIIKVAISKLIKFCPKIKLIVSYADPEQGHHGGIYQGGNWVFVGMSQPKWTINGIHNRAFDGSLTKAKKRFGDNVKIERHLEKYKYLYPISKEYRKQLMNISKPYPERIKQGNVEDHSLSGGAAPTYALQEKEYVNA